MSVVQLANSLNFPCASPSKPSRISLLISSIADSRGSAISTKASPISSISSVPSSATFLRLSVNASKSSPHCLYSAGFQNHEGWGCSFIYLLSLLIRSCAFVIAPIKFVALSSTPVNAGAKPSTKAICKPSTAALNLFIDPVSVFIFVSTAVDAPPVSRTSSLRLRIISPVSSAVLPILASVSIALIAWLENPIEVSQAFFCSTVIPSIFDETLVMISPKSLSLPSVV